MPVKRDCLPCTACCEGWLGANIRGHKVTTGKPCPFSTPGGCGIYESRPHNPCVSFVCSWLVEDSPLPKWMRPDLCGAIVLLNLLWQEIRVISATPVGNTIPDRTLGWLKSYAVEYKRPLLYYERFFKDGSDGLKRFGYGPPEFRRKVADMMERGVEESVEMKS